MSEKRFTIGRESDYREEWYAISCDIKDGDEFIFVGMPQESAKFVVNLLNELNDENEQLRKELDTFKPVIFQDMKGNVILYSKGDGVW